jgi:hypothetical protein
MTEWSLIVKTRRVWLSSMLMCLTAIAIPLTWSQADDHSHSRTSTQQRYHAIPSADSRSALRFTPVTMGDGCRLTLIAPSQWSEIATEISTELIKTHQQLTDLFGTIPPFRSSVRLLDEASFYELTGAPGWTNAMFFRGEIIIPLSLNEPIDLENLHRSVKHEYSHAVFSALSGGFVPGWLDEGLAQWIEGEENPALRNSLRSYLVSATPVPLSLLQGGFTKLAPRMVPAAYAQSLIAVQALLKAYGVDGISTYLRLLREQISKEEAFTTAFGMSEVDFETRLDETLRLWAGTPRSGVARPAITTAAGPRVSDRATRGALMNSRRN